MINKLGFVSNNCDTKTLTYSKHSFNMVTLIQIVAEQKPIDKYEYQNRYILYLIL